MSSDSQKKTHVSTETSKGHPNQMESSQISAQAAGFKNLKELTSSGILNFTFFSRPEKDKPIAVKLDDVKKVLYGIQNSKQISTGEEIDQADQAFSNQSKSSSSTKYEDNQPIKLKLSDLKHRIGVISPGFSMNDFNSLFSGKTELSAQDITDALQDTEFLEDFDPISEAFHLLLNQSGELDFEKLTGMMGQLGYGELDKKDKEILKECIDIDRDGKITEKDLKELTSFVNKKKYLL